MQPRSDTSARFAVGDIVYSGRTSRGTVVEASTVISPVISVVWDGQPGKIIYPMDALYLRKAYPWER